MAQYVVIENGNKTGPAIPEKGDGFTDILGVYDSVAKARAAIVADADRCIHEDRQIDIDDASDYASRCVICKIVDVVQPVPTIRVDWKLKRSK